VQDFFHPPYFSFASTIQHPVENFGKGPEEQSNIQQHTAASQTISE
jgi:hypothetical protein